MTQKSTARSSRTTSRTKTSQPETGFSYSRDFFEDLVDTALSHAKKLGATDADPSVVDTAYYTSSMRLMGGLPLEFVTVSGEERLVVGTNLSGSLLSYSLSSTQAIGTLRATSLDSAVASVNPSMPQPPKKQTWSPTTR